MADQLRAGDPRSVGPYRLTGRLGSGGMGEVFLGRSAGGRLVAVKVIRPELAADPEFRARFRHEVAAARLVNGLYTAPVADAQVDGSTPWLATAYVPGPSLAAAVEEHGPLPARSVLALAAGLAEGLAAVHDAGLVHRDLKPSNVLLAADGPRVIDFGIAREPQATVLTMAGHIIGSPDFMSPEQATGRPVGPPTDVFSLGAVLTYAATGRPPFRTSGTTTVLGRIVNDEPDLSRVPAQVRPIVQWCLAKDPGRRPTPRALLARLGETRLWDDWLPESMLDTKTVRTPPRGVPGRRRAAGPAGDTPASDTAGTPPPISPPPGPPPIPPPPGPPQIAPSVPAASSLPAAPSTSPAPSIPPAPAAPAPAAPAPAAVVTPGVPGARAAGAGTTGRPRRRPGSHVTRWVPAVVVFAAGAGLWLALAHGDRPTVSSLRPPSIGTSADTSPAARSPYRFAATGATAYACSAGLASTSGGHTAKVIFTDKTRQPVQVYWLNYTAKRALHVTVRPGVSQQIRGNVGDAWEVAGPGGCAGEFVTTGRSAHITVEDAHT